MAGSYLHKTPSQNPDSQTTWTISFWIKRCKLTSEQWILTAEHGDTGNTGTFVYFNATDELIWREEVSGSDVGKLITNRKFRDTNGWYHIVLRWDTTNATAGDRMQMFINGVEEGSTGGYSTDTNPSQNLAAEWATQEYQAIGVQALQGNANNHLDAVMTHFHYTDGTAYNASSFGSTNAATGEWSISTAPSVNYGTAGFFILKDAYSGTDQSSNSNNWTGAGTGGSTTVDNPSNNFATLNAMWTDSGMTFSNGNTAVQWTGNNKTCRTTIGMEKGKYYCEFKVINNVGGGIQAAIVDDTILPSTYAHNGAGGYTYRDTTGKKYNNGTSTNYGNSYTTNNIVGIAYDADNGTLWFSKDGVWQNSATIAEIAAGTTTNAAYTNITGVKFFGASGYAGDDLIAWNFGNGFFRGTAISSEGTNASNIGKFEYDVPNGFTALCTKGLNE
tara:strand:+ start:243 stop:1577 length:1335 start_codon:yes stop_codon:yes gene_type:complete